jgi:hypothetical protein
LSWPALKWAFLKRLPAPQKSTLLTLARRDPALDLTLDAIAGEAGLSRSGVKLALSGLERVGLINVQRRVNLGNRYVLNLHCASHDVTGYDVTGHEVPAEESRGDRPASHEVTTNRENYKDVSTESKQRPLCAASAPFTLPSFIDPRAWANYEEMRKKNRTQLTTRAKELAITKLSDWHAIGHDPNAILNNSTMNGYRGLFPPKDGGSNGTFAGKSAQSVSAAAAAIAQVQDHHVAHQAWDQEAGEAGQRRLLGLR